MLISGLIELVFSSSREFARRIRQSLKAARDEIRGNSGNSQQCDLHLVHFLIVLTKGRRLVCDRSRYREAFRALSEREI
jgi:hypothetical protein